MQVVVSILNQRFCSFSVLVLGTLMPFVQLWSRLMSTIRSHSKHSAAAEVAPTGLLAWFGTILNTKIKQYKLPLLCRFGAVGAQGHAFTNH